MTRINSAIPQRCLTDEHLLAEHREIKRLAYCLQRAVACGSVRRIPQRFTLGSGHVLFFIDKMAFARQRYSDLHAECLRRQFEVTDYAANFADIPDGFGGWHTPTTAERIAKMKELYHHGFKTFASIEPVIDLCKSYDMIEKTLGHCDLYKIGLLTGKRPYTREEVSQFVCNVNDMIHRHNFFNKEEVKVYWKDSVPEFLKVERTDKCFDHWFCVGTDYNLFNQ